MKKKNNKFVIVFRTGVLDCPFCIIKERHAGRSLV